MAYDSDAVEVVQWAVEEGAEYLNAGSSAVPGGEPVAGGWFRAMRNGELGWQVGEDGAALFIADETSLGRATNRELNHAFAIRELTGKEDGDADA